MNAANDAPTSATTAPIEGWACDFHGMLARPVIVNPEASAVSLLAWALGELSQLNAMLEGISDAAGDSATEVTRLANATLHFTMQAHQAIEAAANRVAAA